MKYLVRVFEVPSPRKVGGVLTKQKPQLIKEFDVIARTVEGCRQVVKIKLDRQENVFKGKELRPLSFSPEPAPHGSVLVYVQKARQKSTLVRSGKDLGRV